MRKTEILLPESAKEFLAEAKGLAIVVPVLMRDGRFLRVQYSLSPRLCNGEYVLENAEICPDCGLQIKTESV